MKHDQRKRIAIIGAGASGLTAGWELKKKGYEQVVIYEKSDRIGGKTFSFTHKGKTFDIGSMMFSTFDETTRLADAMGIPYESFKIKACYTSAKKRLDPIAYARKYYPLAEVLRSVYRLREIITSNHLREPGFENINPELFQNFGTYIKIKHLEAAAKAFEPAISGLGYGYYEETPAIYVLKIMSSMLDATLLLPLFLNQSATRFFPGGWLSLWDKVATQLDVRTNAEITSIVRTKGKRGVTIVQNGETESFDVLIIASPLGRLEQFLDLSAPTKKLFKQIQHYRMVSTLVEGTVPLKTGFLADNAHLEKIGHLIGFENQSPETTSFVAFQVVPEGMSSEEINAILKEDIRQCGSRVKKIICQKEWEYFYHVKTSALEGGFYDKMNALQGERNTFYLGGILNYETVNHCMQFAEHIVRTHF